MHFKHFYFHIVLHLIIVIFISNRLIFDILLHFFICSCLYIITKKRKFLLHTISCVCVWCISVSFFLMLEPGSKYPVYQMPCCRHSNALYCVAVTFLAKKAFTTPRLYCARIGSLIWSCKYCILFQDNKSKNARKEDLF